MIQKRKIAVPTKGNEGLEDQVSEAFARAQAFTIINVEGTKVENVEVIPNQAVSYTHGAGPVVVKTLTDLGVNMVIAREFGPGVSTLLEHFNIAKVEVQPGTPVSEAIKQGLQRAR